MNRTRTKALREFKIMHQETREDGQVDMEVRVKNRPGRKHGGPMWNMIPYPPSAGKEYHRDIRRQMEKDLKAKLAEALAKAMPNKTDEEIAEIVEAELPHELAKGTS